MADSKTKRGTERERENVNMSEPYEVKYAKSRKTPSKNHPGLTPKTRRKS